MSCFAWSSSTCKQKSSSRMVKTRPKWLIPLLLLWCLSADWRRIHRVSTLNSAFQFLASVSSFSLYCHGWGWLWSSQVPQPTLWQVSWRIWPTPTRACYSSGVSAPTGRLLPICRPCLSATTDSTRVITPPSNMEFVNPRWSYVLSNSKLKYTAFFEHQTVQNFRQNLLVNKSSIQQSWHWYANFLTTLGLRFLWPFFKIRRHCSIIFLMINLTHIWLS